MTRQQQASPFPTSRALRLPASEARSQVALPRCEARSAPALRIGTQVRALRMAAGTSGGDLAQRSGISRSMLSRIEHGQVSPSVETLDGIARGLDVPISRFFGDQSSRFDFSHVPAGHGIHVQRIGAVADYHYELLGHVLSGNLFVEPYRVTLESEAKPYVTFQHPGLKFLYLLSGRVTYRYGAKLIALTPGDSLLFDATALHGIEAIGTEPVCYLCVVFTMRD